MMKKIGVIFFVSFLAFSNVSGQNAVVPHYGFEPLSPDSSHFEIERNVAKFLNDYHFKKFKFDDSLSSNILDNYIESVDGGKLYFTKPEIDKLEKYRYTFDEAIPAGNLDAAFDIFNQYRAKYKNRAEYIQNFFDKPINYESTQTINMNRDSTTWAANEKQLDLEWDKILTNQAISLKLAGITDSAVVATLKGRYNVMQKRISGYKPENAFYFFMNSFTEAIDPHTSYMIPDMAENFNISMSQSIEGIGAQLQNDGEYVVIKNIIPGGPLFKSGEGNAEDYIVAVAQGEDGDYQDIIGWLTDDAIKLIRGKKGTTVKLKLLASSAPAGSTPREVTLVRDKINLEEAVAKGNVVDLEHNKKKYKLGIVDIPMFYRDFEAAGKGGEFQSTTADVKKILEDFNREKVDGVIIDLRNNGGGSLVEAIDLTGLFIKNGPVVQRKTSIGQGSIESDNDKSVTFNGPLLILQNRFSASASEIFAGAIQDYQRGVIVGENSFGKGTVQQLLNLDNYFARFKGRRPLAGVASEPKDIYGYLKFTSEKFYRVTGNSTQLKGVTPDITLPTPFNAIDMGEGEYKNALAYDVIEPTNFQKTGMVSDQLLKKLEEKYKKRLDSSEELKELLAEIDEYKAEMDKREYSLNYETRKKEKEAAENKIKSIKKLRKSSNKEEREEDIYLLESEKILGDMIALRKS